MTYLGWKNSLGGVQYWLFTGRKDYNIDIYDSGVTRKNVFPGWPNSYGPTADTIKQQTFRKSQRQEVVRTHAISRTAAMELGEQIKSAILVQVVTSKRDRITVLVDTNSFTIVKEADKMHSLSFTITYTDDLPSQHV
jgi:hypothetical protein